MPRALGKKPRPYKATTGSLKGMGSNGIPRMGVKKKPSNAAVKAAFASQQPGKKMGIVNPMVCVKKFKGRTGPYDL